MSMETTINSTQTFHIGHKYEKDGFYGCCAKATMVLMNENKNRMSLSIIFGDSAEFEVTKLPHGLAIKTLHNCETSSLQSLLIEIGKSLEWATQER